MKPINRLRPTFLLLRAASALLLLLSLTQCAKLSARFAPPVSAPATEQGAASSEHTQTPVSPSWPPLTDTALAQFTEAKQQMQQGNYQAALTLLAPLAQALPDAAGIHYNLARCYWQLEQTSKAEAQLTALISRRPDYVEAVNLLGVLARQRGAFQDAERYWLRALAQQSQFAMAHKNLGFLYELYLQQPAKARYHYQQYQQLSGDPLAEAWLSLLPAQE